MSDALGEAEAVQPSLMGLVAGALGLAGFGIAYWQVRSQWAERPVPARAAAAEHGMEAEGAVAAEPPIGWVEALADGSYGLARAFANVQSGHLGRYMLVTVLGIAAICC